MDALRQSVGEQTGKKKPVVRADGKPAKEKTGKEGLRLVNAGASPTRAAAKRRKSA
jgi:hypothetical protein